MIIDGAMDRSRRTRLGLWALAPLVAWNLVAASPGGADDEIDRVLSEAGKVKYEHYCMPCHGAGGGPATAAVDLRTYVERNGGKFPAADWIAIVADARPGNVHADVWERIRKDQVTSSADAAAARGVVGQIARYVMSIQAK
jgi:mono/diheme cytochrome c family protein